MVVSWLIRLAFKIYIDVSDILPDTAEPTMETFRLQLAGTNLPLLEKEIHRRNERQAYFLMWSMIIGGVAVFFLIDLYIWKQISTATRVH